MSAGSRLGDSPREDPPSLGDGRRRSPWPPPPSRQPSVPGLSRPAAARASPTRSRSRRTAKLPHHRPAQPPSARTQAVTPEPQLKTSFSRSPADARTPCAAPSPGASGPRAGVRRRADSPLRAYGHHASPGRGSSASPVNRCRVRASKTAEAGSARACTWPLSMISPGRGRAVKSPHGPAYAGFPLSTGAPAAGPGRQAAVEHRGPVEAVARSIHQARALDHARAVVDDDRAAVVDA